MRPLRRYWPASPGSIFSATGSGLGQLALASGVFAVFPHRPSAVLNHELGDQRHHVLSVIVESHRTDDRLVVARRVEFAHDFPAVGADFLYRIDDQIRRREREGAVGFGGIGIFLLLVLFEEELSAGKFLRRRALAEGQYPFGERSETFDECIRDDPGSALENRLDA